MAPLSKGASDRLLNLLYKKTIPEIATKVPKVSKVLYELGEEVHKSVLDDLLERQWEQKPMESAVEDVKAQYPSDSYSNILRFSCKNAYVGRKDLHNIFPINRERNYSLHDGLRKGLQFEVVKSRNPANLLFTGSYNLVFPNFNQACIYLLETKGKVINGFDLNLEFISPTESQLKRMTSPHLERGDSINVPDNEKLEGSTNKSTILHRLDELAKDRTRYIGTTEDPIYPLLLSLMNTSSRYCLVLVKNLPFGLSRHTLPNLLWDYEFENQNNPQLSVTEIVADAASQVNLTLVKFANEASANRFVRNYHGRKWEPVRKEKALYAPILCEIVD